MRTIILIVVYVIVILLLLPLLLFCRLFNCRDLVINTGKAALKLGQFILGLRLEISGRELIEKDKSYIFMPNHLSFLDGPLLFLVIPKPVRVILKKEIFKIPVIGMAMKNVEFVPVDRKGIRGGKISIDSAARLIKEKGYSFLIFPEGTRSLDGELQKFRRGGFFLAADSQTPIVPVTIKGTYKIMPKGAAFVKRGRIRIIFHPPVSVEGFEKNSIPELMEEVRNSVSSGLDP
jgi:1-acyl-sn-glycerol-3-phosphate acyltransferase